MNAMIDLEFVPFATRVRDGLAREGFRARAIFVLTIHADSPETRLGFAFSGGETLDRGLQELARLAAEISRQIPRSERPPNGVFSLEPDSEPVPALRQHPWKLVGIQEGPLYLWTKHYGYGEIEVLYLEDENGEVLCDRLKGNAPV